MDKPIKIILVEDVATDAELIEMELENASISCQIQRVETKDKFIELTENFKPDLIISDYSLPRFNAIDAIKIKNELFSFIPFILVTGAQSEEIAVDCIRKGADDYILKSSLTRLPSSVLNVIKKKKAEQEKIQAIEDLRAREEKYRNLFENSLVGMFRASMDTCRIIEANEKAKELLGVSALNEVVLDDYFLCNNGYTLTSMITAETGKLENIEIQIRRNDNAVIWASVSAQLYPEEGIIEGVISDITRTKNSMIELENTNYELDRFVYLASHDMRSPLRSLEGLIQAVLEEDSIEEIKTCVKMMQRSTTKLDKLIDDLLVLARNKKSEARITPVDLYYELGECIDQLSHLENFSKIKLNSNVQQDKPFYCDAVRLRIILNNLISNAIKYHRLEQLNPSILVDITVSNDIAYIKVIDNGSGIGERHLAKVFDMFYRATSNSEGSGLGLYLVKSTIDKLGGKISISSEIDKGTTFFVEIPDMHLTATNNIPLSMQEREVH